MVDFSLPLRQISRFVENVRTILETAEIQQQQYQDEQDILLSASNRRTRSSSSSSSSRLLRQASRSTLHDIVEEDEDEDENESEDISQREESEEDDGEDGTDSISPPPSYSLVTSLNHQRNGSSKSSIPNPFMLLCIVVGSGWTVGLYLAYPFPNTIPLFLGLLVMISGWTIINILSLLGSLLRRKESSATILSKYTTSKKIRLIISSLFLIYLFNLGFTPPTKPIPDKLPEEVNGIKQKYFIAANMHNNESVLSEWSAQLIKLIFHLGRENTYVSIYESNSNDSTKNLLKVLNNTLENLSIDHRIILDEDNKHWWPYGTAVERIDYLANARNIALKPIQSKNPDKRLHNYQDFTKIIFLNDIWFNYIDLVNLINTTYTDEKGETSKFGDYDQVCAMDYGSSGLYDTWVARDICGTPMRAFWPFVKDSLSIKQLKAEEPIQVTACWNGASVLDAKPFLYQEPEERAVYSPSAFEMLDDPLSLRKRGWRMVDNSTYPGSVLSPPLDLPIKFRTSNISQCDHSECFLISYDLHRYHSDRQAKIYMNPNVKVAYDQNWFKWHNDILEIPVIHWWLTHWSRGYPLLFVDWIWEYFGRKRDYCTWSALGWYKPDRCPSLPGPPQRSWDQ
ncbi:uncharacterized protein L201_000869 [Kwoniella dendrophila CBS 6074]|uniref:Glycosyltransferase family 69 protein n=1 Tax=Kwoniella dendrophila CBS 6074 TaxID=1295534 RepID=A0AAX4JM49_9TREE